tara:strand:+ start:320 stop:703 length:384 start_codon:yes stop_codon:yes gene_type:complete
MVLLGHVDTCRACKESIYRSASENWVCKHCGAPEHEAQERGNTPHMFVRNDDWIDQIPASMEGDTRRQTYKDVVETRSKIAQDGHPEKNCRLSMRVPPAVYHARMKDDKDYWRDPSNSKRHKNWSVG